MQPFTWLRATNAEAYKLVVIVTSVQTKQTNKQTNEKIQIVTSGLHAVMFSFFMSSKYILPVYIGGGCHYKVKKKSFMN